jgi:hypothetical protein
LGKPDIHWPLGDLAASYTGDSFTYGSAYCTRGHTLTQYLKPQQLPNGYTKKCVTCGADILYCCPKCEHRIRGGHFTPQVFTRSSPTRPSFCDRCGSAFPWATRQERIFELENFLESENIDEVDLIAIREQLQKLNEPDLTDSEEKKIWTVFKSRSHDLISNPTLQNLLAGIVSKVVLKDLGI